VITAPGSAKYGEARAPPAPSWSYTLAVILGNNHKIFMIANLC